MWGCDYGGQHEIHTSLVSTNTNVHGDTDVADPVTRLCPVSAPQPSVSWLNELNVTAQTSEMQPYYSDTKDVAGGIYFAWTTSLCTFNVGLWVWSVWQETWFTTDSHTVYNTPDVNIFCLFVFNFCLRNERCFLFCFVCFRTVGCFLCACWSCSHFSTNWRANCSEVDACSQTK